MERKLKEFKETYRFEKWSSDKVFVFVDTRERKRERERERERETNSMYKLWNHVTVESKKELI